MFAGEVLDVEMLVYPVEFLRFFLLTWVLVVSSVLMLKLYTCSAVGREGCVVR